MKQKIKVFITKNITKRFVRDIHYAFIRRANENGYSVLDVAPPHNQDISGYFEHGYTGMGLDAKSIDIRHDLDTFPYPVPDKSHDMVVMSTILEHLNHPEKAIREALRIARKEVYIALPVPIQIYEEDRGKYGHKWNVPRNRIEKWLESKGADLSNAERIYVLTPPAEYQSPVPFYQKILPRPARFWIARMFPNKLGYWAWAIKTADKP